MLVDPQLFENVEVQLRETGRLQQFEDETNEHVNRRMMITETEIPEALQDEFDLDPDRAYTSYLASFDFEDMTMGVAMYDGTIESATPIWFLPQTEDARAVPDDVIQFFIDVLASDIVMDPNVRLPGFTFLSDHHNFTMTFRA